MAISLYDTRDYVCAGDTSGETGMEKHCTNLLLIFYLYENTFLASASTQNHVKLESERAREREGARENLTMEHRTDCLV